jgi:hypothetical protein
MSRRNPAPISHPQPDPCGYLCAGQHRGAGARGVWPGRAARAVPGHGDGEGLARVDKNHIFADEGVSGTKGTDGRPGLGALLAAEAKIVQAIIVLSLDRLRRKSHLILDLVDQITEASCDWPAARKPGHHHPNRATFSAFLPRSCSWSAIPLSSGRRVDVSSGESLTAKRAVVCPMDTFAASVGMWQ